MKANYLRSELLGLMQYAEEASEAAELAVVDAVSEKQYAIDKDKETWYGRILFDEMSTKYIRHNIHISVKQDHLSELNTLKFSIQTAIDTNADMVTLNNRDMKLLSMYGH